MLDSVLAGFGGAKFLRRMVYLVVCRESVGEGGVG